MDYYQPPYEYNINLNGGGRPPKQPANGLSIASLVLGIISDSLLVITCCVFPYISVVCSVIGVILGVLGNKQNRTSVGTAGLVTCIIGLVLSVIMIAFVILVAVTGYTTSNVYDYFYYS